MTEPDEDDDDEFSPWPPPGFHAQTTCRTENCGLWSGHRGLCANQPLPASLHRDGWAWVDGDYAIDDNGRHWQLRLEARRYRRRRYYRTYWHWHLLSAGADRPTITPRSPLQPAKLVLDTEENRGNTNLG